MSILGKEVPFKDIRNELKGLAEGDESRTTATLMNLAVFTEDASQLEQIYSQVSDITQNHACRALSIALDRNAEEETITSWVSAHCNMMNGKKTVCCEHLSFHLRGYVYGRLRNTVFSLLNSDLPLVFWWQGELSDVFEPRLYTLIDRFIFDSSEWSNPYDGYKSLLTATQEVKRRFVIQDLAWTRSYAYRLAFASMFDRRIAQEQLPKVRAGIVKVAEGMESTGLLLLSWLATQARYMFVKGGDGEYYFEKADGSPVKLMLQVGGETDISEISLATDEVSFALKTNGSAIEEVVEGKDTSYTLLVGTAISEKIDLVEDQLSRGGKNQLLRKTIPLFLELLSA